jgi:hypothetical protein
MLYFEERIQYADNRKLFCKLRYDLKKKLIENTVHSQESIHHTQFITAINKMGTHFPKITLIIGYPQIFSLQELLRSPACFLDVEGI